MHEKSYDLQLNLDQASDHLSELRSAFDEAGPMTNSAKWAACVRQLAGVEEAWLKKQWISKLGFKRALVVLAHEHGQTVTPAATCASLLLMLTTSIESRQQKSVWAVALQKVLDGHLDVNRAAEMGVMAAKAEPIRRKKPKPKQAPLKPKSMPSPEIGTLRYSTSRPVVVKTRKRLPPT